MPHQPNHPCPPSHPTPATPPAPPTGGTPGGLARIHTATLLGVTAHPVRVEVATSRGLLSVTTVGLEATASWTTRDRVRAAVTNSGFSWPDGRVTVSVTPAELPKQPSGLDLPVALGLLAAAGTLPPAALDGLWAVGELGLGGDLRHTTGVLPAVSRARDAGARTVVVPRANLTEAALVAGVEVAVAGSLAEVVDWLRGRGSLDIAFGRRPAMPPGPQPDLADVPETRAHARRALEIAAAGGHPLLLAGPAGHGRSMLARRLPGLLPDLTEAEALEIASIGSAAGLLDPDAPVSSRRPLRVPDPTVELAAFTGGGEWDLQAGEVSLAHHGVLLLDELDAYPDSILAALRRPLRDGTIAVAHRGVTVSMPARLLLVVTTTPVAGCERQASVAALRRLDRAVPGLPCGGVQLAAEVPPQHTGALHAGKYPGEPSAAVRERVTAARARQHARGQTLNAHLDSAALPGVWLATPEAWRLATGARARRDQAAAGTFQVTLRVARTIADLDGAERVTADHLTEALSFLPATHTPKMPPHHDHSHE